MVKSCSLPPPTMPPASAPLHLYTIQFSHFCELARWSLQVTGVPYIEHSALPGLHLLLLPKNVASVEGEWVQDQVDSLQDQNTDQVDVQNQSQSQVQGQPQNQVHAHDSSTKACAAKPTSTGNPTPFLRGTQLAPEWLRRVSNSFGILAYANAVTGYSILGPDLPMDLYPLLQDGIGVNVRAILYSHLLHTSQMDLFTRSASRFQRALWWVAGTRIQHVMYQMLVSSPEKIQERIRDLDEARSKVERRFQLRQNDQGQLVELHRFDTLTAELIAVAALFAPAVAPPTYGAGVFESPPVQAFSPQLQQFIQSQQKTLLGQLVLYVYEKHRQA